MDKEPYKNKLLNPVIENKNLTINTARPLAINNTGYSIRHECTRVYKKQVAPPGKMYYVVYLKGAMKTYHAWALCNADLNDEGKVYVYNRLLTIIRDKNQLV